MNDVGLPPSWQGEHHKRDVAMPAVPGAGFIVMEPELVLGGLEAVLDRPAMSLDTDDSVYSRAGRTPGGEEQSGEQNSISGLKRRRLVGGHASRKARP